MKTEKRKLTAQDIRSAAEEFNDKERLIYQITDYQLTKLIELLGLLDGV